MSAVIIFLATFIIQALRFAAARTEEELLAAATNTNFWWIVLAVLIIAGYGLLARRRGY